MGGGGAGDPTAGGAAWTDRGTAAGDEQAVDNAVKARKITNRASMQPLWTR